MDRLKCNLENSIDEADDLSKQQLSGYDQRTHVEDGKILRKVEDLVTRVEQILPRKLFAGRKGYISDLGGQVAALVMSSSAVADNYRDDLGNLFEQCVLDLVAMGKAESTTNTIYQTYFSGCAIAKMGQGDWNDYLARSRKLYTDRSAGAIGEAGME